MIMETIDQAEVRQVDDNYQAAIERHLRELARLKKDKKNLKESLENILDNDADYSVVFNYADEAKGKLKVAKEKVLQAPESRQLLLKQDDLKSEEKEIRESLSALLDVYTTKTGNTDFETADGEILKIKRKFTVNAGQLKLF